jgi:hypothetical protein
LETVISATGRTAMRALPKLERVLVAASP